MGERLLTEADLLLRWCAESGAACGMSMEHALRFATAIIRTTMLLSDESTLTSAFVDLELLLSGRMQSRPSHHETCLSDASILIDNIAGHEVFAIHDAMEFATHSAVLNGWGAAKVDATQCPEAVLAWLHQLGEGGLYCIAVRATASTGSIFVTAALRLNRGGVVQIVDVPLGKVTQHLQPDAQRISLQDALYATGSRFALPSTFAEACNSGLQFVVLDLMQETPPNGTPSTFWSSLMKQPSLVLPTHEIALSAQAATQISTWSARLQVFDPFARPSDG